MFLADLVTVLRKINSSFYFECLVLFDPGLRKVSRFLDKINPKVCTFFPLLQYARTDELEKWRKDHLKAISALKELLDTAEAKLSVPVQVSFLNVRTFLQDVEVRKANQQVFFYHTLRSE